MQRIQPNEIRIIVEGGCVQSVGIGKDVPRDIRITLNDFDLDSRRGEDNPGVEDNGYGNQAYCAALYEPADELPETRIDEDATTWV